MTLAQGQLISIIDESGRKVDGYEIVNGNVDKDGLITVAKDGVSVRLNPKRIHTGDVTVDATVEQPIVNETETPNTQAATAPVAPKPAKVKPTPEKVDLAALAKDGEVWVKSGIDFDGNKTVVNTICLVVESKGRYLSFNSYNGTYGKKGKLPAIQQILDGDPSGYVIKDITKLRERLAKDGYKKHEA